MSRLVKRRRLASNIDFYNFDRTNRVFYHVHVFYKKKNERNEWKAMATVK